MGDENTGLSKQEFMARAMQLLERAFDEDAVEKVVDEDGVEFRFRVNRGTELFAMADEMNA